MPFAGSSAEAAVARAALARVRTGPDDVLILADNSGTAGASRGVAAQGASAAPATSGTAGAGADGVRVIRATGEGSPARARNAGAAAAPAGIEWLLFLDADTRPDPGILDAYFAEAVPERAGALAGEIDAADPGPHPGVATRYATAKNFLNSSTHLAHPFRPRVAAANLLVRRAAFDAIGGFREGIRAAEDTDFCWRLQDAGYTLELRPHARAGHVYRATLGGLRAQWRGYAAGRAWLAREYPGFAPEPALYRAARRAGLGRLPFVPDRAPAQGPQGVRLADARVNPGARPATRADRLAFAAIDVVLGIEELRGLRRSNAADRLG